jgi:hypothetical protein
MLGSLPNDRWNGKTRKDTWPFCGVFGIVSWIAMRLGMSWTVRQLKSGRRHIGTSHTIERHGSTNTAPEPVVSELSEP